MLTHNTIRVRTEQYRYRLRSRVGRYAQRLPACPPTNLAVDSGAVLLCSTDLHSGYTLTPTLAGAFRKL